jgi:hypothetical protein
MSNRVFLKSRGSYETRINKRTPLRAVLKEACFCFLSVMWSTAVILLLWATDKHLLSKIWNLLASATRQACWSALTLYSNWRHSHANDMIKDGYHVDFVYLWEPTEDGQFREIDLLAHFRHHINQRTFTSTKSIQLGDFIQLCCTPDSNFSTFDAAKRYELVVHYTFDHKRYIIVYSMDQSIRFPVYSEAQIRERSLKNTGVITAGMLTVKEDDEDGINIYEHLKKLAGPMDNFYSDTEFVVKRSHLFFAGLKIDVAHLHLKMLDFWGTEFVLSPKQEIIRLEKK